MDIIKFVKSIGADMDFSHNNIMLLQEKKGVVLIKPKGNIVSKSNTEILFSESLKPQKKQKEHIIITMQDMPTSNKQNIIERAKKIWTDGKMEINYKNKTLRVYPNKKHDGFTYVYFYYDVSSLIKKNADILELYWFTKVMLQKAMENEEYSYIIGVVSESQKKTEKHLLM